MLIFRWADHEDSAHAVQLADYAIKDVQEVIDHAAETKQPFRLLTAGGREIRIDPTECQRMSIATDDLMEP